MEDTGATHPSLLNTISWSQRWRDRSASANAARRALEVNCDTGPIERRAAGLALRTLAWHSRWCGMLTRAEQECEMAMSMLRETEMASVCADIEASLAIVLRKQGDYSRALKVVRRGQRRLSGQSRPETLVDLLVAEAWILHAHGQTENAYLKLIEALDRAIYFDASRVHHTLGRFYLWAGDMSEARVQAMRAVASARRSGNSVILPRALALHGAIHRLMGSFERAEACFAEAGIIAERDDDICAKCEIHYQVGALQLGRGRVNDGIRRLEAGRSLAAEMGYLGRQQTFCKDLATAYEASGDLRNALNAMKSLYELKEVSTA